MSAAIRTPDDEPNGPGMFLPPFTENWWYQGQTYPGHSDFAVDFNRRTKTGGWLDDRGDPVLAIADGVVKETTPADGYVLVAHEGGYASEYRHMQPVRVKPGDRVKRGDRLGDIGEAGNAPNGTHLHHRHYRDGKPIKMRFLGQPVEVSVPDSDTRPAGWKPPTPVMVQGPAPKPTWESAFRDASKALDKAEAATAAQKAQTTLATDERDQARRELDAMRSQWQEAETALLKAALDLKNTQSDLAIAAAKIVEQDARIAELEAATPQDCDAAVKAERERVVDALVAGVDLLAASVR